MNEQEGFASPAALLKKAINVHGELHLDKVRTEALVRWMEAQERHWIGMEANIKSLLEAIKPIIGAEAFQNLTESFRK